MKKINHTKYFLHAMRTAILFIAGFFIYEILLRLEKLWEKINPSHKVYNFYKLKTLKFAIILTIDLIILYGFLLFFGIEL